MTSTDSEELKSDPSAGMWTAKVRRSMLKALPPETMLPDEQPAYVSSWIYVFGVITTAALVVVIGSGLVLSLKGPQWWHVSSLGRYVNSVHLWSVELFFFGMVVHLWGKFFMAAWRGKRAMTWILGVVTFLASIVTGFTGYLSQSNFDSQWIATQAKDGINSTGGGAFFHVMDLGQMLMWHIALLPIIVVVLTGLHIAMVRIRGVVPPFADIDHENEVTS
ncbi:MAG: cytochrome b N-terminal domain-containing protein [Actinobacteria bacterium]|nr:cytochrome b N-terminal domain-containing protein [Actinomycetota bacterium]